jgi:hypothetical protein
MVDIGKSKPNQKAAKTKEEARREQEEMLNSELEDSFPASDPPSLTQPTPEKGSPVASTAKRSNAVAVLRRLPRLFPRLEIEFCTRGIRPLLTRLQGMPG